MQITQLSGSTWSCQSVPHYCQLCLCPCGICCFPFLHFVNICLPKGRWCPKSMINVNMFNLSDKVKNWDLLKGSLSLAEVRRHYRNNESSIHSTALNAMHPDHTQFFLNVHVLGTTAPQKSQVYLMYRHRSIHRVKFT
jgi:hypothetical protein